MRSHLEHGRRRVTAVIGAELVDLVEQQHRIRGTRLAHRLHDAAGHGADVGAAMAADLGLVAHAAERHAGERAVHGLRERATERALADARRSHQAQDRSLAARRAAQLAHREELEDALLHLVEIGVILLEHLARALEIEALLAALGPGQIDHPLQVRAHDLGLGRIGMHALEPRQLTRGLGVRLDVHARGLDAPAELLDLGHALVGLSELGLDRAQLLAQERLALRARHLLARLRHDLRLHRRHRELAAQQRVDAVQPAHRVGLLEQLLRLLDAQPQVGGDQVGEPARIIDARGDVEDLGRQLLERQQLLDLLAHAAHQGLGLDRPLARLLGPDLLDLDLDVGLQTQEVDQLDLGEPLHQDLQPPVGQPHHAHEHAEHAHRVQVLGARVLGLHRALRGERDHTIALHGSLDGLDREVATDE
jgi:hypothetical protein